MFEDVERMCERHEDWYYDLETTSVWASLGRPYLLGVILLRENRGFLARIVVVRNAKVRTWLDGGRPLHCNDVDALERDIQAIIDAGTIKKTLGEKNNGNQGIDTPPCPARP